MSIISSNDWFTPNPHPICFSVALACSEWCRSKTRWCEGMNAACRYQRLWDYSDFQDEKKSSYIPFGNFALFLLSPSRPSSYPIQGQGPRYTASDIGILREALWTSDLRRHHDRRFAVGSLHVHVRSQLLDQHAQRFCMAVLHNVPPLFNPSMHWLFPFYSSVPPQVYAFSITSTLE